MNINFFGLTRLEKLTFRGLDDISIDLSAVTNLKHFNCEDCTFLRDVRIHTSLRFFVCTECSNITNHTIEKLTTLTHLSCRNTAITDLKNFEGLATLSCLFCSSWQADKEYINSKYPNLLTFYDVWP